MESKGTINTDQSVMINSSNSSNSSMLSHLEEVGQGRGQYYLNFSKSTTQTTKTQKDDITMVSIF